MSLENQVRDGLPPFFVWHTVEDPSVPVQNFFDACRWLTAHKVPLELHLFRPRRPRHKHLHAGGQHPQQTQQRLGGPSARTGWPETFDFHL